MSSTEKQGFESEWLLLQNQFDGYEKYSLLIKLLSISIVSSFYLFNYVTLFTLIVLLILWMQDAIWKTFQSRIEPRLLDIEQLLDTDLLENSGKSPYQFNRQYHLTRPNQLGLIKEYISQALRPTVAYPYIVLVMFVVIELLV